MEWDELRRIVEDDWTDPSDVEKWCMSNWTVLDGRGTVCLCFISFAFLSSHSFLLNFQSSGEQHPFPRTEGIVSFAKGLQPLPESHKSCSRSGYVKGCKHWRKPTGLTLWLNRPHMYYRPIGCFKPGRIGSVFLFLT